jgi:hypothetical protein
MNSHDLFTQPEGIVSVPEITGDPVGVAREYLAYRDDQIARHRGQHGALMGNASRATHLQIIDAFNRFAARFANQFPNSWNEPEWEEFSRLDRLDMSVKLDLACDRITITNQAEWEGCSELAKTYLAILRQRQTP